MYKAAFFLFLCVFISHPRAEDSGQLSGLQLLEHCRVYSQLSPMPWGPKVMSTDTSVATCLSYLDARIRERRASSPPGTEVPAVCMPAAISPEQLAMVLVNYAEIYPTPPGASAADMVDALLARVFPCKP